jgi:putative tricarboxylic transport membrane protein
MTAHRRFDTAGLIIGLLLLALAGIVFWDMDRLALGAVYGVGPKAMPIVIGMGLVLLGLGNAVIAVRGGLPERETVDLGAIVLILGGLAALIALVSLGGGFILATAILFAAVARAFGRRAFVVDFMIGCVLGAFAYVLFAKLLALTLPVGPLERLI